jgi:hypothetical protein
VGKKGLDEFIETLTKKMNLYTEKLVQMNATALLPPLLPSCNPASPLITTAELPPPPSPPPLHCQCHPCVADASAALPAMLPPPLCQHCHPAPAANTVLQMSCFHRAATMLLLLTLPDERTKTQT